MQCASATKATEVLSPSAAETRRRVPPYTPPSFSLHFRKEKTARTERKKRCFANTSSCSRLPRSRSTCISAASSCHSASTHTTAVDSSLFLSTCYLDRVGDHWYRRMVGRVCSSVVTRACTQAHSSAQFRCTPQERARERERDKSEGETERCREERTPKAEKGVQDG